MIKGSETRKAGHPIDSLFLDRWSPRAMSGEEIPEEELLTLFEAARWAPSYLRLRAVRTRSLCLHRVGVAQRKKERTATFIRS
jgi:hypothetical protein